MSITNGFLRDGMTRSYVMLWWCVAMVCAVIFTRLIPPFQSPDENVHVQRGMMLANGQVLLQKINTPFRDSGMIDKNFAAFAEGFAMLQPSSIAPMADARGYMESARTLTWAGSDVPVNVGGTGYYFPLIYAPHAIGFWLAKQLGLSPLGSYDLMQAIVIGTALALAAYACVLIRPNALMVMIALMPMSIFQLFSPTIDGLCNAMVLVLLALWVKLANARPSDSILRDEVTLYVIVFLLCTTRTHLLPILLVPATLLAHRFSITRLLAFTALIVAILGWVAFAAGISNQTSVRRDRSTKEIILLYLQNPMDFFLALGRTLNYEPLQQFYSISFIGALGWLKARITQAQMRELYLCLAVGLVLLLMANKTWALKQLRLTAVVIGVCSVLVAYAALAVTFNDFPANLIDGIQGRYFIPVALILAFALGPLAVRNPRTGAIEAPPYTWPEIVLLTLYVPYSVHVTAKTLIRNYDMGIFG